MLTPTIAPFSFLGQNTARPLGSSYAPGTVDMTALDADNAVKQQITDQVFPPSQRNNTPGFNASALQVIIDALNNGYIRQYYATDEVANDCSAASPEVEQQIKLEATGINVGAKLAGMIPIAGQAISEALQIFSAVFNHHTQAVQQEQTILCTVVPQINNAIQNLDNLISTGQITLQQAYQALQVLQNAYLQQVQSIYKNTSGACNAACVIDRGIVALILYRSYQYNKVVTNAVDNPASNPAVAIANNPAVAGVLTSSPIVAASNALSTTPTVTIVIGIVAIIIIYLLVKK